METFTAAQERGIPIIIGTDAGTPQNQHGSGTREFEQFVKHGFSETQALHAGTRVPAEILGLADEIGTIEAGKRADLVVVSQDPRSNITTITVLTDLDNRIKAVCDT